ncbi:TraG/TraD/VirD4 family protein, partial [Escherichia coli]|nr:TraG/TraD/VirD4 family protein [Escherichia coli]
MQAVEDAISLVRGYGAAFWLFVQDLSQLKAIYPKWQTFLANTGKQFFGTADYDTAKFISDSLGKFTVEYRTQGSSSSMGTANLH